jgi:hypothetical protein
VEAEIMLGKYSVSFILTILLAWVFGLVTDNPDTLSNRLKKAIAVLSGIGLSILAMFYQIAQGFLVLNLPTIVDFIISGFLIGAASIGINQLMKSEKKT